MKKTIIISTVVLISAAFIAIGIFLGEHTDVFNKAVRICLECIGIG